MRIFRLDAVVSVDMTQHDKTKHADMCVDIPASCTYNANPLQHTLYGCRYLYINNALI